MYAIIETGGKQYKVSEGDIVEVEKLPGEKGQFITFDRVLMIGGETPKIGQPIVSGASVTSEILGLVRGPKVITYKYRRRRGFHKKIGHRQYYTRLKINKIYS